MTAFQDLVETLRSFVLTNVPGVNVCMEGYPDTKFLQLDGNLPGVFFVIPSARMVDSRSVGYDFGVDQAVSAGQATGYHVLNKREYMIQAHIVANTKGEVVNIGDTLWSAISQNPYVPLQEHPQNTFLWPRSDNMVTKGEETNYHRRVITFTATLRELASDTAPVFQQAQLTGSISAELPPAYRESQLTITLQPGHDPIITTE